MALNTSIPGSHSKEFASYRLEAYEHNGAIWLTTATLSPANLSFSMTPEQARFLAGELVKLAESVCEVA